MYLRSPALNSGPLASALNPWDISPTPLLSMCLLKKIHKLMLITSTLYYSSLCRNFPRTFYISLWVRWAFQTIFSAVSPEAVPHFMSQFLCFHSKGCVETSDLGTWLHIKECWRILIKYGFTLFGRTQESIP